MPLLEVLAGGVQTTVQDRGRGYRSSGVPSSGAMDHFALSAANFLVGNPPHVACLEILLGGLELRFLQPASISVTGGDLQPRLDNKRLDLWTTIDVAPGQMLGFAGRAHGARAYLAASGGIGVMQILHSSSTYLPGGWGGFEGRALRRGDVLEAAWRGARRRPICLWLPPERRPPYSPYPTLRCVSGPHHELFDASASATFFGSEYTLSPACDRMGYRLDGPSIGAAGSGDLPSVGVLPGAIQIPPHGQPILLMADAQTTGGYPIAATIIGADLPLAAQLLPGDRLRFRSVTVETAVEATRARSTDLAYLEAGLQISGAPV